MRTFKVITIALQLKNQRIAKYGETVDESQLNGNAAELEKNGFVSEISQPKKDVKEIEVTAPENGETVEKKVNTPKAKKVK